jgi:hypothetical protein
MGELALKVLSGLQQVFPPVGRTTRPTLRAPSAFSSEVSGWRSTSER